MSLLSLIYPKASFQIQKQNKTKTNQKPTHKTCITIGCTTQSVTREVCDRTSERCTARRHVREQHVRCSDGESSARRLLWKHSENTSSGCLHPHLGITGRTPQRCSHSCHFSEQANKITSSPTSLAHSRSPHPDCTCVCHPTHVP